MYSTVQYMYLYVCVYVRGGSFAGKARGLKEEANLTMFFFLLSCCCWLVVGDKTKEMECAQALQGELGTEHLSNQSAPSESGLRQADRRTERERESKCSHPPPNQPASQLLVLSLTKTLPLFPSQACFPTTHDEIQFPRSAGSHGTGSSRRYHATLLLAEA